jgi:hypothetical protein
MTIALEKATLWYCTPQIKDLVELSKATSLPLRSTFKVQPDLDICELNLSALRVTKVKLSFGKSDDLEQVKTSTADGGIVPLESVMFVGSNSPLINSANVCYSVMLHCPGSNIAAAVHTQYTYKVPNMLKYAIYHMKKLSGENDIFAYVSGGFLGWYGQAEDAYDDRYLRQARGFLEHALPELIHNGIGIKELDFGGDYSNQTLNPKTGEYKITFTKGEPSQKALAGVITF